MILQNDVGNHFSPTVIVASITDAKKRPMPTHHNIEVVDLLTKPSTVMLEQIRTIDKSKLIKWIADLSDATMREIDAKLKISFGLVPVQIPSSMDAGGKLNVRP